MITEIPELLTIPQVCKATKMCRSKVYALARNGGLPTLRIGGSVRVSVDALRQWIAEGGAR